MDRDDKDNNMSERILLTLVSADAFPSADLERKEHPNSQSAATMAITVFVFIIGDAKVTCSEFDCSEKK